MGKSDKRILIVAGIILGIFAIGNLANQGTENEAQPTPTPTPTPTATSSDPEPSQTYDKYALDTACADEAIVKGYKASSLVYGLDHPVSVDEVGLYDRDGKEVLLVRGPIATSDKVDTQYTCYIRKDEGAKPTVLEIDGKALDGSYLDSLYDKDGKSMREKYGDD